MNSSLSKRKSRSNLLANGEELSPNVGPNGRPLSLGSTVTASGSNSSEMHVPYLNSKLTHALKDIVGGNSKSTFIFNLAPEADCYHPNVIAIQNISKAMKIINQPKVNRIIIPDDFSPVDDEFPEVSIITQLRQYYVEPLLKSVKSFRRSTNLTSTYHNHRDSKNFGQAQTPKSYNLCIRSVMLYELPEISVPMLPWMKIEVGSNIVKSPKLLYTRGVATYNDVVNFEIDSYDLEAGIPLEIRVYSKKPYRYRVEIGRGRLIIKNAFPVLEEISELEILLYRLASGKKNKNGTRRIIQQGRIGITGIFRLSNSKSALYDLKMISPKKSALMYRDRYVDDYNYSSETIVDENGIDLREEDQPVLLSLRKFSSHDAFIALVDHADAIGSYKFSLEAKLGQETYRTPFIAGKGRYRGKEVIANVLFHDPNELQFEVKKSHLRSEQLQIILYVQGCSAETVVVGRTIVPLQSMIHLLDEEILDLSSQLRNISNTITAKVNISLSLSVAGMKQRIEAAENYAANLIANALLPEDFENGWIRISSVIAARLNTLKLLGNEIRYDHSIDKYQQYTKQDLLLAMEYKDTWASLSPVLNDQRDYCHWQHADFKLCVQRKDLLYTPIKFSVFNRKLEGKSSLIGSTSVYLHQLCVERSLMMHELPITITGKDGRPAGVLIVEGMIVKDNGSTWVSATIVKVRPGGRYDVRYEDGQIEENVSKDLLKPDLNSTSGALSSSGGLVRGQSQLIGSSKAKAKYPVGMVVEVVDARGEQWYPAQIALIHPNGTYDVKCQYHDVPKIHLHEQHIRPLALHGTAAASHSESGSVNGDAKGLTKHVSKNSFRAKFVLQEKVEFNYKSKGKWYPCKIGKVHNSMDGKFLYDVDFLNSTGNRECNIPEDRLRKYGSGANNVSSPSLLSKSSSLFNMTMTKSPSTPNNAPTGPANGTSTPKSTSSGTPNQLLAKSSSALKIKTQGSNDTNDSKYANYNKYSTASSRMRQKSPSSVQQNLSDGGQGTKSIEKRRASVGMLVSSGSTAKKGTGTESSTLKKTMTQPTIGTNSANGSANGARRSTLDSKNLPIGGSNAIQSLASTSTVAQPVNDLNSLTFDTLDATSVLTDNENDDDDLLDNGQPSPTMKQIAKKTLLEDDEHAFFGADAVEEEAPLIGKYGFVLGDRVEVNFRMIGKWYPGYIKRCRGNGIYDIDYDDGSMETRVDGDYIRLMEILDDENSKYRPGDAVDANTGGFGYWNPAIIIKVRSQGKYDIQYDNGDQEFLVTERLLRFQCNDSIIPKIRPFFSMGERVFVKTRSSTLDNGIKSYREMQRQANQDLTAVFKIMKHMEEEEGQLNLVKKKTRFILTSLLIFKEDVRSLSGTKSFFEENGELKLKQTLDHHEKIVSNLEGSLYTSEAEVQHQKEELRKALAEIANIQRKNSQFRSISVSSRSGVEEEEYHVLTVAQENVKEEIKSLEKARHRALEVIDSISSARQSAVEKLKAVVTSIKVAKQMVEHVLDQELDEPTMNIFDIVSPSNQSNSSTVAGETNTSHRKAKKSASNEVDYGHIYGTKDSNDDVDIGYDNLYGQSYDSYSTRGGGDTVVDVYMPCYDENYRTGLGGLLLGDTNSKKPPFPFTENNSFVATEELNGSRELPSWPSRRRHSSTDEIGLVELDKERVPCVDRRLKLTKHYYLNASNQSNGSGNRFFLYNLHYDTSNKTFIMILNNNNPNNSSEGGSNDSRNNLLLNPSIIHTVHPSGNSADYAGSPTMAAATLTKDDLRILEKKKAAEEKKARASIAQAAYFKYAATLSNDREQCDSLNKEIEQFIEENELHYILDNKFGVTYEASKARIQPMLAIALQCDQTRLATEESAFKFQREALKCYEKALNARKQLDSPLSPNIASNANIGEQTEGTVTLPSSNYSYLSPEEIMKLWDATKAAYVMEWSTWEEARVMIEEEKAAYKNVIITINRSYRDLSQLTKIRNDVTTYLAMRQEYFEKKVQLLKMRKEYESKQQEYEKKKEEIHSEANVNESVIKAMTPTLITSEGVADNSQVNSSVNNRPGSFSVRGITGAGSKAGSFAFSPFANESSNGSRRNSGALFPHLNQGGVASTGRPPLPSHAQRGSLRYN